MKTTEPAPLTSFTIRQWSILAVGLAVTAFLALGSHDLAIAHLGIPYPADGGVPEWARYLNQVVRLGAMVYFCRLASWYFDRRSMVIAARGQFLVETLILAALTGLTWAAIMPPIGKVRDKRKRHTGVAPVSIVVQPRSRVTAADRRTAIVLLASRGSTAA